MRNLFFLLVFSTTHLFFAACTDEKQAALVKKRNTANLMNALSAKNTAAVSTCLSQNVQDSIDFGFRDLHGQILFDYFLRSYPMSKPIVAPHSVDDEPNKDIVYAVYKKSKDVLIEQDSGQRFLQILRANYSVAAHDLLISVKNPDAKMFSCRDKLKRNVVHYAVQYGQGDILRALHLNKIACKWNQQDKDGRTPFMLACQLASSGPEKQKFLPLVWYLLHNDRVDFVRQDNDGRTVYDYCQMVKNERLKQFVLGKLVDSLALSQKSSSSLSGLRKKELKRQ